MLPTQTAPLPSSFCTASPQQPGGLRPAVSRSLPSPQPLNKCPASCICVHLTPERVMYVWVFSRFSHVWLFATPQTVACQAPLSMGFSRQEYWSGLPLPTPGDLPDAEIKPASLMSPALTDGFFTTRMTELLKAAAASSFTSLCQLPRTHWLTTDGSATSGQPLLKGQCGILS